MNGSKTLVINRMPCVVRVSNFCYFKKEKVMHYRLRSYQEDAVRSLMWSKSLEGADLCVLPTGAGKSLIIAELSRRLDEPILILQPSKEILEQNYAKLKEYVSEDEIGIYSASVGRKDLEHYTFATIQSIYKKPKQFYHFKYVIVDECHLINIKKLDSMYTSFLKKIGDPKVVGLTATPYRMDVIYRRTGKGKYDIKTHHVTKLINRSKDMFWHRVVFNINIGNLIADGYLVPLTYIDMSVVSHDELTVNKSASDFSIPDYEVLIETGSKAEDIHKALWYAYQRSKHVLVFCSSVEKANQWASIMPHSRVVSAQTPKKEREKIINGFRDGSIKAVFNVGVLTTGFDFPELDCIVLLRPTRSIGLYYQMLGRGVRKASGKNSCLVVDVTGTVKALGGVETIKLDKVDNRWELLSEKGSWHDRILYSYDISDFAKMKSKPEWKE